MQGEWKLLMLLLGCWKTFQRCNVRHLFCDSRKCRQWNTRVARVFTAAMLTVWADGVKFDSALLLVTGATLQHFQWAALCSAWLRKVWETTLAQLEEWNTLRNMDWCRKLWNSTCQNWFGLHSYRSRVSVAVLTKPGKPQIYYHNKRNQRLWIMLCVDIQDKHNKSNDTQMQENKNSPLWYHAMWKILFSVQIVLPW
jgi:hypothetical protein